MRLAQFGRKIASETHLEKLLEILAEEVRELIAGERCSVFIADPKRRQLWARVAHGMEGSILRVPIDQGIVGHVARTGSGVNIANAYRDRRFTPDTDRATGFKTEALLAIPLKDREGKVLGVFQVLNKKGGGAFDDDDEGFLRLLAMIAASAIENAQLYDSLRKSHLETIYRLGMVAEFRDQEDTAKHLRHISKYSAVVARAAGLPEDVVDDIRYASPLHDIGKVAVPDAILRKPGKLTPEEFEEIKRHPEYGAKVLENAESRLLKMAYRISIAHHEQWDGSGYPKGLKGEAIPIEAQVVSIVDVFDALTTKRVYKAAWSVEDTVKYLAAKSGRQFNPRIVDAFMKSFPELQHIHAEENSAY